MRSLLTLGRLGELPILLLRLRRLDENVTDALFDSMACAIREAYAATLTVVILVDDEQDSNADD